MIMVKSFRTGVAREQMGDTWWRIGKQTKGHLVTTLCMSPIERSYFPTDPPLRNTTTCSECSQKTTCRSKMRETKQQYPH